MRQATAITYRALVILCFSILTGFQPSAISASVTTTFYRIDTSADARLAALEILKNKCNGCHARQNPSKVFTAVNMNSLAPKIYEQVFTKKRMPRGKQSRLTEEEYNTLKNWLITQNLTN